MQLGMVWCNSCHLSAADSERRLLGWARLEFGPRRSSRPCFVAFLQCIVLDALYREHKVVAICAIGLESCIDSAFSVMSPSCHAFVCSDVQLMQLGSSLLSRLSSTLRKPSRLAWTRQLLPQRSHSARSLQSMQWSCWATSQLTSGSSCTQPASRWGMPACSVGASAPSTHIAVQDAQVCRRALILGVTAVTPCALLPLLTFGVVPAGNCVCAEGAVLSTVWC
jgi:hypothetical protein